MSEYPIRLGETQNWLVRNQATFSDAGWVVEAYCNTALLYPGNGWQHKVQWQGRRWPIDGQGLGECAS